MFPTRDPRADWGLLPSCSRTSPRGAFLDAPSLLFPLLAWLAWTSSSCELHSQQCYPAVPCFRCKRTFHLCFPQPGTQRASRSNCWVQVDMPVWLGTHRGGPLVPWQCLLCCMCLNSGKLRKLRPSLIFVTPLFLLLKDDSSVPVLSASLHLMGAD